MENKIVQIALGIAILVVAGVFYQYSRDFVAGLYEIYWYKYYEVSPHSVRLLAPVPILAGIGYYTYRRLKRCKRQES